MEDISKLLTVKQAAKLLGIAEITLRLHMGRHEIEYYKIFGRCLFSMEQIQKCLQICGRREKCEQLN